jgi:hypothetical protein
LKTLLSAIYYYLNGISASSDQLGMLESIGRGGHFTEDEIGEAMRGADVIPFGDKWDDLLYLDPMRTALRYAFITVETPGREPFEGRKPLRLRTLPKAHKKPLVPFENARFVKRALDKSDKWEWRRRACHSIITHTLQYVQGNYMLVSRAYAELRITLLKPR